MNLEFKNEATRASLRVNTRTLILGDPGATSGDDAIFSGESLLQELKSPGNLFLPNQFQKWSNSVPLIGEKK